jgi:YD repeat-containing protein
MGALVARYDYGFGLIKREDATANATEFTFDANGNTTEVTDTLTQLANSYAYTPFGTILFISETVANPFAYVGEWGVMKEGSDLDFMRARYYDTSVA